MTRKNAAFAISLALLTSCGSPEQAAPELVPVPETVSETNLSRAELLNRGQGIAEAACATCHAIGEDDVSQHPDAPAFRIIGQSYDVWTLDEAFAEGIMVGHPDMPVWELVPDDIDGLLTYMDSVQME